MKWHQLGKCHIMYDPDCFRQFCISATATKLFDTILNSVTTAWHSADCLNLNKKRVVLMPSKLQSIANLSCSVAKKLHSVYIKRGTAYHGEWIANNMISTMSESHFSNSLIITHEEKTKEITVVKVWICEPNNYHKIWWTFALNFFNNY